MYPKCRFFLYILIEISFFRNSFVSGIKTNLIDSPVEKIANVVKGASSSLESKNPLDEVIPKDKSHIYIESTKIAIETTSKLVKYKPLIVFAALDETCLVNQTSQSLNGKVVNSVTVASMTGGILGNEVYELLKGQFYWQNFLCNATHNLEGRAYYYNTKYGSYENALEHSDGVIVVNFPIVTTGDYPNPKFDEFSKILRKKIKKPGDFAKVHCGFTFIWFVNFPYGSIYHTYTTELLDEELGKTYTAVVIDLPLDPHVNYISNKQFKKTFGKIKGVSEESLNGNFLRGDPNKWTERHKGICIVNLPA